MPLRVTLASAVLLLALSCARFAPLPRTAEEAHTPDAFTLYETRAPVPDRWWEAFHSEELNNLIEEALTGNLTLQQVAARLTQAEMLAQQAGAARYPELDVTGDISATRRRSTPDAAMSPLDATTQQLGALNTFLGGLAPSNTPSTVSSDIRTAQSQLQAAQTLMQESAPRSIT
ncbi:MAG TPA: hypothetical protein ENN29_05585, partial [Candidatus Hydrogenedentes bacterium]|nr:hypothetical protein [Candidatus Hydrogenedentota bacterium]